HLRRSADPHDLHSFPTRRSSDLTHDVIERYNNDMTEMKDMMDQQNEIINELSAKIDKQQEYINNRLEQRDNNLMKVLEENIITRSEEHTSELQSRFDLVCRLLLE